MRLQCLMILATLAAGGPAVAANPDGAALFGQACSGCHQEHGEGIPGAFPALAGSKVVTGYPDEVARILLYGRGGMPSFKDGLSDDQLSAVASHIRASWGNKAAPIPAATFARLRAAGAVNH